MRLECQSYHSAITGEVRTIKLKDGREFTTRKEVGEALNESV